MMDVFWPEADQRGSMMVTLLLFVVVGLIVTTVAFALIVDSSTVIQQQYAGTQALIVAETGAENAILRLLRDPGYTGETVVTENGTSVVTVTGSDPLVIRSEATRNSFVRIVEVSVQRVNGVLTVISWQETE